MKAQRVRETGWGCAAAMRLDGDQDSSAELTEIAVRLRWADRWLTDRARLDVGCVEVPLAAIDRLEIVQRKRTGSYLRVRLIGEAEDRPFKPISDLFAIPLSGDRLNAAEAFVVAVDRAAAAVPKVENPSLLDPAELVRKARDAKAREREMELQATQALREEQNLQRAEQRRELLFWQSPKGQARRAKMTGQRWHQAVLPLRSRQRGFLSYLFAGVEESIPDATDVGALLTDIESEGWRLRHAGWLFEETGAMSRDRGSQQSIAVTGRTDGVYLFEATDDAPLSDKPWLEITDEGEQALAQDLRSDNPSNGA